MISLSFFVLNLTFLQQNFFSLYFTKAYPNRDFLKTQKNNLIKKVAGTDYSQLLKKITPFYLFTLFRSKKILKTLKLLKSILVDHICFIFFWLIMCSFNLKLLKRLSVYNIWGKVHIKSFCKERIMKVKHQKFNQIL